jgi:hypothetical protein
MDLVGFMNIFFQKCHELKRPDIEEKINNSLIKVSENTMEIKDFFVEFQLAKEELLSISSSFKIKPTISTKRTNSKKKIKQLEQEEVKKEIPIENQIKRAFFEKIFENLQKIINAKTLDEQNIEMLKRKKILKLTSNSKNFYDYQESIEFKNFQTEKNQEADNVTFISNGFQQMNDFALQISKQKNTVTSKKRPRSSSSSFVSIFTKKPTIVTIEMLRQAYFMTFSRMSKPNLERWKKIPNGLSLLSIFY